MALLSRIYSLSQSVSYRSECSSYTLFQSLSYFNLSSYVMLCPQDTSIVLYAINMCTVRQHRLSPHPLQQAPHQQQAVEYYKTSRR